MSFIRGIYLYGDSLRNPARSGDPTYHTGGGFGPQGFNIKDDQTTPAQASSGLVFDSTDASPIWHGYANVKSGGGTAHAALYATDRLGGLHLISGPIAVSNTAGYDLIDFGLFQLDEGLTLDIRIYGPSGAWIQTVALMCRPDDHDGADLIDPSAPAWVTTSGTTLINSGEPPDGGATYSRFILYPATAHEELVEMGALYYESGDAPGPDDRYITYFSQPKLNGVDHLGVNFADNQVRATDANWTWADTNLLFGVTDTMVVTPGDDVELWAQGGYAFVGPGYNHSLLHVTRAFLGKLMESLTMACSATNESARTVGYSHPRPAAIASYEARVYYYNSGIPYLKEVVETGITANPYVFPPQPPTGLGDDRYLLVIRAYYYDGSWIQDGCFYTPPPEADGVFRTRHKVHA